MCVLCIVCVFDSARAIYCNDKSEGVAFHDAYDENNGLTYDKKFKKRGMTESDFVWSENDIIKVVLNCNKWNITFFKNGMKVGKAIPLTKNRMYYPALCVYGNCEYKVL